MNNINNLESIEYSHSRDGKVILNTDSTCMYVDKFGDEIRKIFWKTGLNTFAERAVFLESIKEKYGLTALFNFKKVSNETE